MSFLRKKHVVIDLEALGGVHEADTVILAISALVIAGNTDETYEDMLGRTQFWKLSTEEQVYSRGVNPETNTWWEGQKESVKEQCFYPDVNRDISPRDALIALNVYLASMGVDEYSLVWTRGTAYDIPKLLHLYDEHGITPVFNSWNVLDTKTAFMVRSNGTTNQFGLGGNPVGFEKHNALHDTALEAFKLARYFKEVGKGASIRPQGSSAKSEQSVAYMEGDHYSAFETMVLGHLTEHQKAYTKEFNDLWLEVGTVKATSPQIRSTLYRMRDLGKIKAVKDGLYSHWELM